MTELIVGLSGHIDHGKTSIIKSLTNEFSGTLKEDESRGMTVDLGIAFLNDKITLIDVPGHQDFIKNMLSGVQSIDLGLLVIAADDGIMPQTKDHFDILKLLDVSNIIILINKIDLVDSDMLELVKLEISDLLVDSKYENADILEISTIENIGIKKLKEKLENFKCNNKKSSGPFRMPIDRIFSVKGFGTVVTGTVTSGSAKIGNEVKIEPISKLAKIRGINTHNSSSENVVVGQRAAINLQNIDKADIKRGYQLVDKHFFKPVRSIIAKIKTLDDLQKPIKRNQRIRFHLGTAEVIGKIYIFSKTKIDASESSIVLINLEKPILASFNDKFIIRHYSPIFTMAGGKVLLHSHKKNYFYNRQFKLLEISDIVDSMSNIETNNLIKHIINNYEYNPVNLDDLCIQLGYSKGDIEDYIKSQKEIFKLSNLNKHWILTSKQFLKIKEKLVSDIKKYFNENKYSSSINKEELTNISKVSTDFLDFILIQLEQDNLIQKKNDGWSLNDYVINLSDSDKKYKQLLLDIIENEKFNTSSISDLKIKVGINTEKDFNKIIKICENEKLIIRISQTIILSANNFNFLKEKLIDYFEKNQSISVSEFKDLLDISRKYAIPFLEYLDKIKITYRNGNSRELLK